MQFPTKFHHVPFFPDINNFALEKDRDAAYLASCQLKRIPHMLPLLPNPSSSPSQKSFDDPKTLDDDDEGEMNKNLDHAARVLSILFG